MPRTFRLDEAVFADVLASTIWSLIFESDFETKFHEVEKHTDIAVSEWLDAGNNVLQRMSFYTMTDNDVKDNDFKSTRCTEIQRRKWEQGGDLIVESTITPENSGAGRMFSISSKWVVHSMPTACTLAIEVQVESKIKGWLFVDTMVENALVDQCRRIYTSWLDLAKATIQKESEAKTPSPATEPQEKVDSSSKPLRPAPRRGARPAKRLQRSDHIVESTGTENIVALLQSSDKRKELLKSFLPRSTPSSQDNSPDVGRNKKNDDLERGSRIVSANLHHTASPSPSAPKLTSTTRRLLIFFILLVAFAAMTLLLYHFHSPT